MRPLGHAGPITAPRLPHPKECGMSVRRRCQPDVVSNWYDAPNTRIRLRAVLEAARILGGDGGKHLVG